INKVTPSFSNPSPSPSQTISCGTSTLPVSGQLHFGSGPNQVAPNGETVMIDLLTIPGGTVMAGTTATVTNGNAGAFNGVVPTGSLPAGTYRIRSRYTAVGSTNFNAATDNATTTLTVNNCNQPPVAACKDVTVSAGANCTAAASIDNGSS